MTDLRKAAEMALEALDCLPWQASPIAREATQALRQALAQPKQKYDYRVKYDRPCYKCRSNFCPGNCKEPKYLAQPEQEPVECMCGICKLGTREWQGLTKDDKHFLLANAWNKEQAFDGFMEAIDKFLEEKNT